MSNYFRRAAVALLAVGVVVALSTASFAQKQALPKYDKTTEIHIANGTVLDTKDVTVLGQERYRLTVKDGDNTWEVCLCPKAFLDMMDSGFAKGDQLEITGSKVTDNEGKPLILAREITKGQNTLVLRDKNGEPVWTWMEKKTAEGK